MAVRYFSHFFLRCFYSILKKKSFTFMSVKTLYVDLQIIQQQYGFKQLLHSKITTKIRVCPAKLFSSTILLVSLETKRKFRKS